MKKFMRIFLLGPGLIISYHAMAMSDNTIQICDTGQFPDDVACKLYMSGYTISSTMACSMCTDIMGCVYNKIYNMGTTTSAALQECYDNEGYDNGDVGAIFNIIAGGDTTNLDVNLSGGNFIAACQNYSLCQCWIGTYGASGENIVCNDCPQNGWSATGATSITQCYMIPGNSSDTTGQFTYTANCFYTN